MKDRTSHITHFIKLINAADTPVTQHQSTADAVLKPMQCTVLKIPFQNEMPSILILSDVSC